MHFKAWVTGFSYGISLSMLIIVSNNLRKTIGFGQYRNVVPTLKWDLQQDLLPAWQVVTSKLGKKLVFMIAGAEVFIRHKFAWLCQCVYSHLFISWRLAIVEQFAANPVGNTGFSPLNDRMIISFPDRHLGCQMWFRLLMESISRVEMHHDILLRRFANKNPWNHLLFRHLGVVEVN